MRRYQFFAARDGDIIDSTIEASDEDEARMIAAHRMKEQFDLDAETLDFDALAADTDGVSLDEIVDLTLADAATSWACAQLPFLEHLKKHLSGGPEREVGACISATLKLVVALDEQKAARAR